MTNSDFVDKKLTGRHVLLMLIGFFGLTISVNIYFMTMAVKSFRGEDVKGSYRQGLEYNQILKARRAQETLGWSAKANVTRETDGSRVIIIQLETQNARDLTGMSIKGVLRHRIDASLDQELTFLNSGVGRWTVLLDDVAGEYTLKATATAKDDLNEFTFRHSISLP